MQPKKLMFIVLEDGIQPDVMEVLEHQGVAYYTRWANAEGRGETGPRHGDPVWPGLNDVLMVALDEARVQPLVEALHAMRDSYPLTPGLKIMIVDAMFV